MDFKWQIIDLILRSGFEAGIGEGYKTLNTAIPDD